MAKMSDTLFVSPNEKDRFFKKKIITQVKIAINI